MAVSARPEVLDFLRERGKGRALLAQRDPARVAILIVLANVFALIVYVSYMTTMG
jgi:hypothetical protein